MSEKEPDDGIYTFWLDFDGEEIAISADARKLIAELARLQPSGEQPATPTHTPHLSSHPSHPSHLGCMVSTISVVSLRPCVEVVER